MGTSQTIAPPRMLSTHFKICVDDEDALCVWYRLHDENLKSEAIVANLDDVTLCQA